jgi:hypothetical protein
MDNGDDPVYKLLDALDYKHLKAGSTPATMNDGNSTKVEPTASPTAAPSQQPPETTVNPRFAMETQASTPSHAQEAAPRPEVFKPHWKANLALLTACWSLAMIVLAGNITMASLATADILKQAEWPQSLATLPLAVVYVGATVCVLPVSKFMRYRGRRAGFVVCGILGVISGCVSLLATELARLGTVPPALCFSLIILGSLLLGVFDACMGFLRYAAAEERHVRWPSHRPRANCPRRARPYLTSKESSCV